MFRGFFVLTILTLTVVFFQNCGKPLHENLESSSSLSSVIVGSNEAETKALTVLQNNCASCHGTSGLGGVSQITNPQALYTANLIVPGDADASLLVQVIENNSMPPSGPLSAADKALVRDWIAAMTGPPNSTGSPAPAPAPMPAPAPPIAGAGTLETRAITILTNACFACHGTANAGGVNMINNAQHLVTVGLVIPGNAAGSPLYSSISSGRMPPSGPLAAADVAVIAEWINAGARAPAGALPPTPAPIPLAATYRSIQANILGPKCVSCHGAVQARAGVRLDSYAAVLRTVSVGNPNNSELFESVDDGDMPQGGPRLSNAELNAISQWIANGALNN